MLPLMPTTMPGSPATVAGPLRVFDKTGKPLTPPDWIYVRRASRVMQGVIVTPSSDVWGGGGWESTRPLPRLIPDQGEIGL